MSDYLGALTLSTAGTTTYTLTDWKPSNEGATITAEVGVMVRGTSAATLIAAMEALSVELHRANVYVHTQPGAANPVVYQLVSASAVKEDSLNSWAVFWQRVSFTMVLASLPQGALTSLYTAQHLDSPASLSLAALLGTNPTPLDVTIDDDSGYDMHSVWCALAPSALLDTRWLVKASALTWTTMTNGTGSPGTWVDGTYRYTTSSSYQTAPLDTSQYPAGKYKLLVHAAQSAGTGYVKDSQNEVAIPITRTTFNVQEVGDLDLPVANTAFGTAANLTLSVKSDGTNNCWVDAFVLLPLDYGYFRWHHDTVTSEIDQLDVGPSGVFMDGVCDTTYLRGNVLVPKTLAAHVGTLVPTPNPTGSSWPTDWGRTDAGAVTADTSRFKLVGSVGGVWAYYGTAVSAYPLVVPGAWYEYSFTRQVTAFTAGWTGLQVVWSDVDGNVIRIDTVEQRAATDASPVACIGYLKAPVHAARALYQFLGIGGVHTVYYSAAVLRRCPLRLIVVAEDADATLSGSRFAVHVSVKYTPRYEVAR